MKTVKTEKKLISEVLNRSIDTIYPSKEALQKKLESGDQLKIYVGIDPTADYVHLGHSTNYIILKRFQEMGHKIVVLVGDFTAMIGDPSDKTSARVKLTREQVEENLKTFKKQIGKIVDFDSSDNPVEFVFNSKWLSKLIFEDVVELASNFTVQQMLERDAFQKRLKENKPLYVHEFFYPLMQGYDSVAMDVDVEIGGTDQTFNMLAGRTLLKRYKDKEKFVITTTLLENPVTGEKLMSKSLGTGVGLDENPVQMFGKIMALPDEGIMQCFVDCTYLSMDDINDLRNQLKNGSNPRDIKLRLAREVVTMYHDGKAAEQAETDWIAKFSNRDKGYAPDDAPNLSRKKALEKAQGNKDRLIQYFVTLSGVVDSMSEARRLFEQGAVKINGEKVTDITKLPDIGDTLQIGKKHYFKISE